MDKCSFCGQVGKHSRLCHFNKSKNSTNLDKVRKDKYKNRDLEGKEPFNLKDGQNKDDNE